MQDSLDSVQKVILSLTLSADVTDLLMFDMDKDCSRSKASKVFTLQESTFSHYLTLSEIDHFWVIDTTVQLPPFN